jgi:hypothetical protein
MKSQRLKGKMDCRMQFAKRENQKIELAKFE